MNIYIYGNKNFKDEIHNELNHANIKFKLPNGSVVKDISDLLELKNTIKENPNDIYLIDDEKIIKNSVLNNKIKFFIPKDGIEENYLLEHGIKDLSVDSIKEVSKYIVQKIEKEELLEVDDKIQNSIIDIVDEAYKEDENVTQEEDNLGLEETKEEVSSDEDVFSLDDELSKLLANEPIEESIDDVEQELNVNLDEVDTSNFMKEEEQEDISIDEFNEIMKFDNDVGLENTSCDYDDKTTLKNDEMQNISKEETDTFEMNTNENTVEEFFQKDISVYDENTNMEKGEEMDDKFSQLNSLNENDILEAISSINGDNKISNKQVVKKDSNIEKIFVENYNVDEISSLISKLLNNKTLEITIKVKD